MTLETTLLLGTTAAALVWAALSAYVLHVNRRRGHARSAVSAVLSRLRNENVGSEDVAARVSRVKPLLDRLSRDMILHTAADAGTPADAFEVLTAYMLQRWAPELLIEEASAHRRARDVWRRTAALRIVFRLGHEQAIDLLARGVDDPNGDVAAVALALLGTSSDPRAVDIMIAALHARRHPASRIAMHLESSPQHPVARYRELLTDADPVMRFWGATLLGRYPGVRWLEAELAVLANDPDARVRKAAIESLGKVGEAVAADAALRLLQDPAPFVRAHAARALGDLERSDRAPDVAALLGDRDWWVRLAAKQSLETMGPDVWPVLVRCLDNSDGFVRNGAAEVFQNIGVLDSFIVMEAASDDPSHAKVDLLRRIAAAGGTRLTDSLVERVGPTTGPRVRRLLETIGLEHVGAA